MKWERVSKYAESMQAPRGLYHVSAGLVVDRWRFTAWPPRPTAGDDAPWQERVHNPLGCFDDATSARRCCEDHAALVG